MHRWHNTTDPFYKRMLKDAIDTLKRDLGMPPIGDDGAETGGGDDGSGIAGGDDDSGDGATRRTRSELGGHILLKLGLFL